MFVFEAGGTDHCIGIDVAEFDQELITLCLREGAIVNISGRGGAFQFASMSVDRALRTAMAGDILIHPSGKTFVVGD